MHFLNFLCHTEALLYLGAPVAFLQSLYIVFRQVGNKQYSEVFGYGKTGMRHLPLIGSLPYVKSMVRPTSTTQ